MPDGISAVWGALSPCKPAVGSASDVTGLTPATSVTRGKAAPLQRDDAARPAVRRAAPAPVTTEMDLLERGFPVRMDHPMFNNRAIPDEGMGCEQHRHASPLTPSGG